MNRISGRFARAWAFQKSYKIDSDIQPGLRTIALKQAIAFEKYFVKKDLVDKNPV